MLIQISVVPECQMFFRLQKHVTAADVHGTTSIAEEMAFIMSIPVKPGDFNRIRVLQLGEKLHIDFVVSVLTRREFTVMKMSHRS